MTSTRGSPRLGQSSSSLTSLGAVGGPRGTAAGALRVIVEFVTNYDPAAIKQLEADLHGLTSLEESLGNQEIKIADKVAKQRAKIAQAEALITAKIRDRASKSGLKEAQALRAVGGRRNIDEARELEKRAIAKAGFTAQELKIVNNLQAARTRLRTLEAQSLRISQDRLGVAEQTVAVESELSRFQQLKSGLPSKLGGLALGALGGLVGGAVIGAGFAAAQAVIDAVGEAFLNVVDPARQARKALDDVAAAIIGIMDADKTLTANQAAAQYLKLMGISADEATTNLLAQAVAAEKAKTFIDNYMQSGLVASQATQLYNEQVKRLTDQLVQEARAAFLADPANQAKFFDANAFAAAAESEAIYRLGNAEKTAADETQRLADKQAQLDRYLEATATLARYAAEALDEMIHSASQSAFINPLDRQIGALQGADPTSAKTAALQKKLESLQGGGGGTQKNSQLANVAEERSLILLRQRLRLLGTSIDLEKYEGKFLLEAINAKIRALDKQAAAQDLVNKKLDLAYRMSQVLRRNQGESVNDFLERRAQENRSQLTEQRQLEQESIKAGLEDLKDRVSDEVALQDLAEKAKTASATSGADSRIKAVQKELEASKKADADALKAKIDALEEKRKALEKSADDAAYYSSETANLEITEAARAANSVAKIAALSGKTRGLFAAREFLTALLQTGALNPKEAAQFQDAINRINKTLAAIGNATYDVSRNTIARNKPVAFAEGGYLPLTNSHNPFGSNVRFGEQGTEGALILNNKVMNKLGQMGGQAFGDINIYRSDDPARDYYRTKQMIREVVRDELRA